MVQNGRGLVGTKPFPAHWFY